MAIAEARFGMLDHYVYPLIVRSPVTSVCPNPSETNSPIGYKVNSSLTGHPTLP